MGGREGETERERGISDLPFTLALAEKRETERGGRSPGRRKDIHMLRYKDKSNTAQLRQSGASQVHVDLEVR